MKKIVSLLLMIAVFITSLPLGTAAKQLTAEEMADVLSKMEILHGEPGYGYDFYGALTRAQFTKLAVAASQYKNSVPAGTNTAPYSDVGKDHWAAGYIKVAVNNQLISGYPDSTFRPEAPLLLEEAVTIVLKLLGYQNSDFGGEWPNGQMGIARNLRLLEDVEIYQGQNMNRLAAIILLYNTLDADSKQGTSYLQSLGYEIVEDVTLIASYIQDENLDPDRITTSSGVYRISSSFNIDNIGRKGDMLIKNNRDILSFYPISQTMEVFTVESVRGEDIWITKGGEAQILKAQSDTTVYRGSAQTQLSALISSIDTGDTLTVIYNDVGNISYMLYNADALTGTSKDADVYAVGAILGSDILVYKNGNLQILDIKSDTTAYYNSTKTTYGALAQMAQVGDTLSVVTDNNGKIRYISADTSKLEGPFTVTSEAVVLGLGSDIQNATILKSGDKISLNEIDKYDIVYYSQTLNTIWVYNTKKTGIYQEAMPNQEFPTSISLSGTVYELESAQALSKLKANGDFSYGDTITLLIGKDGKVADVVSASQISSVVYGYVLETGRKTFTVKGESYSANYINIVTASGDSYEYACKYDYSKYEGIGVKVDLSKGLAEISSLKDKNTVYGKFDDTAYRIGSEAVSRNIQIIDVKNNSYSSGTGYTKVYPARISGVTLSKNDIIYAHKNESGQIDQLILDDVTGDAYNYGIMKTAPSTEELSKKGVSFSCSYTYVIDGNEISTTVQNRSFPIRSNTPARFGLNNGQLAMATALSAVSGGVFNIDSVSVTDSAGKSYPLSDKLSCYLRTSDYNYMLIPQSTLNTNDYILSAYYDKSESAGGRVRVIVARQK